MVATIPNDVFQYSLAPAFHAPHSLISGGPPSAFLTRHGTYGLGFFAPSSSTSSPDVCALVESTAWRISAANGTVKKAEQSAQLPFVMVTVFEGVWGTKLKAPASVEGVKEVLFAGEGERGGRNSYMPFRLTGDFKSVRCEAADKSRILEDVKGTVFGVYVPPWAEAVSGKTGLHCVFLGSAAGASAGEKVGGLIEEFEIKNGSLEWGVCGRFHLGLPSGGEWEGLDLGTTS